ncbi:MAG: isoprenyl transferase [Nitrospinota bacterium]|nr:isoprenyl transferase [Nitrospinota bacterium]
MAEEMNQEAAPRPDPARMPGHIAIIMDGNGRWARQKGLPRIEGHRAGVKVVDRVVSYCRSAGIKALTLYSFSSENWNRPSSEVGALMKILKAYVTKELSRMLKENIRFNAVGALDNLPGFAREAVLEAMESTKNNDGMTLTLALSYGAREEIAAAARRMAQDVKNNILSPDDIDENIFSRYLYTHGLPDPDLLIRTSGELRISNFLLWQIAYTELYFTPKLWPEFTPTDVEEAIVSFQARQRRFGLTGDQLPDSEGAAQ